jgi:hypothetical protein
LDSLIRRQATGNAGILAGRLGLSRSSLFDMLAFLRNEMRAPIRYSKYLQSYIYDYPPKFHLGFEREQLQTAELNDNIDCTDNIDEDEDIVLDDYINFNDLYLDDN